MWNFILSDEIKNNTTTTEAVLEMSRMNVFCDNQIANIFSNIC